MDKDLSMSEYKQPSQFFEEANRLCIHLNQCNENGLNYANLKFESFVCESWHSYDATCGCSGQLFEISRYEIVYSIMS